MLIGENFIIPLSSIKSVANLRQNIKLNLPQIVRPGFKNTNFNKFKKPILSILKKVLLEEN